MTDGTFGRRTLLRAGVLCGAWLAGCAPGGQTHAGASRRFRHGVASFDPLMSSLLLWSRLTDAADGEPVTLWVARDAALTDLVASATLEARADAGFVLLAEVAGLAAGTDYFFVFETAAGERSAVGRTRTAPSHDAPRVRFAFTACASYAHGYFHTYARIAEQEPLDAVVHLGDYIYEYGDGGYGSLRGYDPPHEILSLADYRRRYAHYRLDPDLARLHARHPMIVTWDDHEFANNAHRGGALEHQEEREGSWAARVESASQAHREWLPHRASTPGSLYRKMAFSDLVDLFVLDTRLEGRSPPASSDEEARAADRTILGAAQRERLLADLRASRAPWKVIAHSVQFSPHAEFWNGDAWDGYQHDRRVVLEAIRDADIHGVIFVCGDGHKSFADELPLDPTDGDSYDSETGAGSLAVELMTPAASSPNLFGDEARELEASILAASPHTRFVETESRGYWVLDLDATRAEAELHFVAGVEDPEGGREHVEVRFEVERGARAFTRTATERLRK